LLGSNGPVSHLLKARNPAAEAPVYEVGDRREGHLAYFAVNYKD